MCMEEIRNRKSLQSKVNICKSDVKIGDYADSLSHPHHVFWLYLLSTCTCMLLCIGYSGEGHTLVARIIFVFRNKLLQS